MGDARLPRRGPLASDRRHRERASQRLAAWRAGEWNAWLEGSATFGRHDLAAGVTGYHFPDPARARLLGVEVFDTWEVYARWRPRLGHLTPGVAVWVAMEDVHGAYIELSTAYRLHALPLFLPAVHLEALVGLGADLAADGDGPGPYVSNGFTHAIVSLSDMPARHVFRDSTTPHGAEPRGRLFAPGGGRAARRVRKAGEP